MPRGGVSVKFSPQALQRYRCRPFMKPFLTCSPPPHRLHRSPIVPLRRSFHRRRIWAVYARLKPCSDLVLGALEDLADQAFALAQFLECVSITGLEGVAV